MFLSLGGFNVHHKDWLTYSGGPDRPGEHCYKTTLLRQLTFLLRFLTVTLTVMLFWIYFFLLMLVFVLQWLSLHWEILMLLSQFLLTLLFFLKLGFTPCNAKQPLQGMELQEKYNKKITGFRISPYNEPTVNRCLLTLDLMPFRSYVKEKHSIDKESQSLAVRGKKLLR